MDKCPRCGVRHPSLGRTAYHCLNECHNDYGYLALIGDAASDESKKERKKRKTLLGKMKRYIKRLGG